MITLLHQLSSCVKRSVDNRIEEHAVIFNKPKHNDLLCKRNQTGYD